MMMTPYDELASLLTAYFCNEFYIDGIWALRRDIGQQIGVAKSWDYIVTAIRERRFSRDQPLHYIPVFPIQLRNLWVFL